MDALGEGAGTPGGRYEVMLFGEGWHPIEVRQVLLQDSTGDVVFTGVDPQKPALFRVVPLE